MRQTLSHLARGVAIATAVVAAVLWPCAPGAYDPLALPVSMVARIVSWSLLLLVPVGVIWWCRDTFAGRPVAPRLLGRVTVGVAILVGGVLIVAAAGFGGTMLALLFGTAVALVLRALAPRCLRAAAGTDNGNVALWYLAAVPLLIFVLHLSLFERAVAANRARVIASAAPLIAEIENFRQARGAYPESLFSSTTDYRPRSASVARFRYERAGDAYNLIFEQPPAALDMREFVVFNPAGRAVITSHDGDLLRFQGEDLERRRGFPSSADVPGHPGWRVFRFD